MKRLIWPLMLLVLAVSFIVAVLPSGSGSARTAEQRVAHLSSQIRCPTCSGLSVAESDAALARSSKDEIVRRVNEGQSDQQIRDYFVSRYGDNALMSPERRGIASLPWVLPVVLALALIVLVVVAVRRWRNPSRLVPTDDDRELVEAALRART